ncbi:hypothetical protein TRFO_14834 [Tritrichomonas foetus]|uniref:Guanylate cyclase domain-containing protein n=1 Tax=Tritrichomonas foetus TaxID=1144522 RepID=A0A1J4KTS9_9EUKA|nr:hypothetical protein TRFO_14834 [Tritrichomonas foetus]|eukprot:OHT14667.1 hypothetical protein TRFO_14834 [Tritrichomonas foetus]
MKVNSSRSIESSRDRTSSKSKKDYITIKNSVLKRIQHLIYEMINYTISKAPPFFAFAFFTRVYLMISIITFAFLPHSKSLFPDSNLTFSLIHVLSSFFMLRYSTSDYQNISIPAIVLLSIYIFSFLLFVGSLVVFRKSAKLPTILLCFLNLVIMIGPLYCNFIIVAVSHLVHFFIYEKGYEIFPIVMFALLVICFAIFWVFYYFYLAPTLYFRPKMIVFYTSQSEKYYYIFVHSFTFFSVTFSADDTLVSILLTYIPLLFLIGIILYYIYECGIVLTTHHLYDLPIFLTSFITLLVLNSLRFSKKEAPTFIFFFMLIFYLICICVTNLSDKYCQKFAKAKLNDIEHLVLTKDYQFFWLFRHGLGLEHITCYNLTLLRLAVDHLQSQRVFITFAKFSAYYLNEEDNLFWASTLLTERFNEIAIRNLAYQILSLIQSRESSLSLILRKELGKLHRKCVLCRSIMRYMWQNVIRNDLTHIDRLSYLLYSHLEKIDSKYAHLILNYAHNHFVVKSYAYFLSDVVQRSQDSKLWKAIEAKLRQGSKFGVEFTQDIAKKVLGKFLKKPDYDCSLTSSETVIQNFVKTSSNPHLMKERQPSEPLEQTFTIDITGNIINTTNEISSEERERLQVENMINQVRLPSMKFILIIIFLVFSVVVPLLIICPFLVTYMHASIDVTAFLAMVQSGGLAPAFIQTIVATVWSIVASNGFAMPMVNNFVVLDIPLEYWPINWGMNSSDDDILFLTIDRMKSRINTYNSLLSTISVQKTYFDAIVSTFYSSQYLYTIYDVNQSNTVFVKDTLFIQELNMSMEAIFAMYIAMSYRVTTYTGTDRWFQGMNGQDFRNIELNSDVLSEHLNIYSSTIIDLALRNRKQISTLVSSIYIITTLLIILISVITWIVVTYLFNQDSRKIYSILQFVPKSEISHAMHILAPKEEDESIDNRLISMRNKTLRVLITPIKGTKKDWISLSRYILTILIIIISIVNCAIQLYLKNISVDTPFNSAPMIYQCGRIHTQIGLIVHKLIMFASRFNLISVDENLTKQEVTALLLSILPSLDEFRYGSNNSNFYKGLYTVDSVFAESFVGNFCEYYAKTNDTIEVTPNVLNLFFCQPYETSLSYITNYVRILLEGEAAWNYDDSSFSPLLVWLFKNSYEEFVLPTEEYLMKTFTQYVVNYKKITEIIALSIAVFLFLIGIIFVFLSQKVALPVYNCLRLLLFVDPSAVLSSKPIMKLLSNDFSSFKAETTKYEKYLDFFTHSKKAVLISSNDGSIKIANELALDLVHETKESIMNKNIIDVIHNPKFSRIFTLVQGQRFQPTFDVELADDNSLHLSCIAIHHSGEVACDKKSSLNCISFFCFIFNDRSDITKQNLILEEETQKCRKLIWSYFPKQLVNKISQGQSSNINYLVPMATIVYFELINFPKISDRRLIFKVLNMFITEFDRIIDAHPSMTRIKSSGNSFMAVGGIFETINQPSIHAIDAVSFALDVVQALQMLSIDLRLPLKCRCGINTGGPISAGIVGKERPSFEVYGTGIYHALKMQETAQPMSVHITESVYNLIFSGGFSIRESDDVMFEEKNYKTFNVNGYVDK